MTTYSRECVHCHELHAGRGTDRADAFMDFLKLQRLCGVEMERAFDRIQIRETPVADRLQARVSPHVQPHVLAARTLFNVREVRA